jgi:hypothetical protein
MMRLNLSWLVKTLRPYSLNPKQAYQEILSQIFGFIYDKSDYWMDSSASSRITNNEYDFPFDAREKFNNKSDDQKKEYANEIFNKLLAPSSTDKFISKVKQDVKNSDLSINIKQVLANVNNEEFFFEILKVVVVTDNRIKINKKLYSDGNKTIKLISGDIISFAFNKKPITCERVVVIPVDEAFTMIIDEKKGDSPISKDSIHGKWIIRMNKIYGDNKLELNNLMEIECKNGIKIKKVKYEKTEFYLVPISKLGERNMAKSSKRIVKNALDAICQEYDISGQGRELFIPLLGTGRARVNITKRESINLIQEAFLRKKNKMHGNINIVVYIKDIDNIGENLDAL